MQRHKLTTAICCTLLALFAAFSLAGTYRTKTVFNPFTGKMDYVLDGKQVFASVSTANAAAAAGLDSYSALKHKFSLHSSNTYPHDGAKDKSGFGGGSMGLRKLNTNTLNAYTYSSYITWENGVKTIHTPATEATDSVAIPDTIGMHYVYFLNGILQTSTTPWDITGTAVPIATVYNIGNNTWAVSAENHSSERSRTLHKMLHLTVGARYSSGLDCNFTAGWVVCTEGVIYDEDLRFDIANGAPMRAWYNNHNASSTFINDAEHTYYAVGTAMKFNNNTSLTTVSNNNYVANYLYATNDVSYPYAMVIGQGQHNTITAARSESQPTIRGFTTQEWKLIYRMISRNQAGTPTYIESTDYRTSSSLPGGVVSSLPASSVTYTAYTSGKSWTNVQQAITETNRSIPVACGTDPTTAIFDGRNGVNALFCNISGLVRAFSYDASGSNPAPALSTYVVQLWEAGVRVVAQAWSWWTGGSSNRVYGTGATASFTPSQKAAYSAYSSNNYLAVQVKYSTAVGRRYCVTGFPYAVSKSGTNGTNGAQGERGFRGYSGAPGTAGAAATIAVGTVTTVLPTTPASVTNGGSSSAAVFNFEIPKGADGDPGAITQAQILDKIDDASTGILGLQGTSDSDVKAKLLYASGAVSLYITSAGLLYAQDSAGKLVWGWDNTNKVMKFSNWSTASARINMTIDQKGQIKQYGTDGRTLIFASNTSGRIKYWSRTGKLVEHIEPDGKRTLYRPNGTTPRMQNYTSGALVL